MLHTVDPLTRSLDTSTIKVDTLTVTVRGKNNKGEWITDSVDIEKTIEINPQRENFGGVTEVPTQTSSGEPLLIGDYFLANENIGSEYIKGEIYEYTITGWERSTNGDLVMTLFDSFAELANDVDSTILGNAVIKKLVAMDAVIKNLQAQNLKVGVGDGSTGGFRFRAMSDRDMDGGNIPVFRCHVRQQETVRGGGYRNRWG